MATGNKKPLAERWKSLPPKRRQQAAFGAVIAGVLAISFVMLTGTGGGTKKGPDPDKMDAMVENGLLPDGNMREIGMSAVSKDIEEGREATQSTQERVSRVEESLRDFQNNQQAGGAARTQNEQLLQQVQELTEKVQSLETNGGPSKGGPAQQLPAAPIDEPAQAGYGGIRNISNQQPQSGGGGGGGPSLESTSESSANSDKKTPAADGATKPNTVPAASRMYLPSGSIIRGVMLTGLDAPTGTGSNKDPVPVLVRIQKEAILPNRYLADVKECFALISGTGDLASERAYLRSETISCIRKDKSVIDTQLKSYVVDTDGKAGLRGRLVSKQGSAVGKAIIASFADGISQAFKGGSDRFDIGNPDYQQAAQSGAISGASSSLDRISKYYLDLANQMFPILEIDAGREVTLVLVQGLDVATLN